MKIVKINSGVFLFLCISVYFPLFSKFAVFILELMVMDKFHAFNYKTLCMHDPQCKLKGYVKFFNVIIVLEQSSIHIFHILSSVSMLYKCASSIWYSYYTFRMSSNLEVFVFDVVLIVYLNIYIS